jgi:hypothetical protein
MGDGDGLARGSRHRNPGRQAERCLRAREGVPEPGDLLAVETAFMAATQALHERQG